MKKITSLLGIALIFLAACDANVSDKKSAEPTEQKTVAETVEKTKTDVKEEEKIDKKEHKVSDEKINKKEEPVAEEKAPIQLSKDEIYFFYFDTCPHCHHANDYVKKAYPDLKINYVDIYTPEGYEAFVTCAKNFNLGNRIGTPLFCMGDQYLMGWGQESEHKFDQYVQPFLNK